MSATRNRALRGWTVVTTRPVGRAASLARALGAAGARVHALPCASLRVNADRERAQRELADSRQARVAIFTSPSAVRFAFALHPGLRWSRSTTVLAVGAATARALSRRGVHALTPERYDSEGLLALDVLRTVRGMRVDIITAPQGRELLADRLRARGARVRKVFVYERVAPRWSRRHLAPLTRPPSRGIVVVSSAEAVATLVARLPASALMHLQGLILVASSTRVADLARRAGWHSTRLARSALPRDLCAACVAVPQD
jgi:uroporphyrinogen-III synthase